MASLEPIEVLRELVAINSTNPFQTVASPSGIIGLGNEGTISEYLEKVLVRIGFQVERQVVCKAQEITVADRTLSIPARYNLLAKKGKGTRSLLFLGHSDTVDVKEGWKTDPFTLTEVNHGGKSRLYGLGSNDMKGGLAAILAACADFNPKDFNLKVAFVVDEEFFSFGAHTLLQSSFLDDVALALVPEIGDDTTDPSMQWIGLGRLGRAEIKVTVQGVACHGADAFTSTEAVNAVHESVKLQRLVIDYCNRSKKTFCEGEIQATNSAFISNHQGGSAILSVPDRAGFSIDRTYIPGEHLENEVAEIRRIVEVNQKTGELDPRAKFAVNIGERPTPACEPYFFPRAHKASRFVESLLQSSSYPFSFGIGRSVADENRLAKKGVPTIVLGPSGHGSHSPTEWVDKDSVFRVTDLYRQAIERFSSF